MAGEKPWPKLFQNMRASRETELIEDHPIHVVCSWIGNSAAIAAKHYLQVRESDFERAAESAAVLKQKAQQQAAAPTRTESQETKNARENRANRNVVRLTATPCDDDKYPLGESNPCCRIENPESWATRRRGRGWDEEFSFYLSCDPVKRRRGIGDVASGDRVCAPSAASP